MKMKDLDSMPVEEIIRQPFFHSMEKDLPCGFGSLSTDKYWKITLRCNKKLPSGEYQLLDLISENEFIIRYKLIDFK